MRTVVLDVSQNGLYLSYTDPCWIKSYALLFGMICTSYTLSTFVRRVTLSCYVETPLFLHRRQLPFVFLLWITADLSLCVGLSNSANIGISTKVNQIYICHVEHVEMLSNYG